MKERYDLIQQNQDTDSPLSNTLHCVHMHIHYTGLFACNVSVYKSFSLFSQHHQQFFNHKIKTLYQFRFYLNND